MRSVVVVFPASICAAIPIFLVLSSPNSLGIIEVPPLERPGAKGPSGFPGGPASCLASPARMSERFARLRHPVAITPLLDGRSLHFRGSQARGREFLFHLAPSAGRRDLPQPANPQRLPPVRSHFDRDLIRR